MVAGAISDPTQLCNELMTLDCKVTYIKGEKDETVCGTNGVTYDNLYEYLMYHFIRTLEYT